MIFGKPIFIIYIFFIYLFIILTIFFSCLVVLLRNPIYSVLSLIAVFCCITFVFLLLGLEFIAIIFLIVYVGAIAVLFLFVVMMLNIKIIELDYSFTKYLPFWLMFCLLVLIYIIPSQNYLITLITCLENNKFISNDLIDWFSLLEFYNSNTFNLAVFLYTYNFYSFMIVTLILFVAMVGAIALVLVKERTFIQPIFKQVSRRTNIN
jgi:NADH-quinone oxidoreductase subunit J